MKFLAILRVWFRYAIDGKIFYVMLGLSGLLAVLVASVTFTPLPAEEAFQNITKTMGLVIPNRGDSLRMNFFTIKASVEDVQTVRAGATPPEGDYRFTLELSDAGGGLAPSGVEIDEEGKGAKPVGGGIFGPGAVREAAAAWLRPGSGSDNPKASEVTDAQMEEFVAAQLAAQGNVNVVRVTKLPTEKRAPDRFGVETKGGSGVLGWPQKLGLFFGAIEIPGWRPSLGSAVNLLESTLVNGLGGWIALLVSVVITAGFIPNLMRKGAIDLLLAKPTGRTELLVYKYLGGLVFIFLTAVAAVGSVWLAVGLRTGFWGVGFLACILALTFYFAVLYAVSTLTAVLTRNTVVSIIVTCFCWFLLWLVGFIHTNLDMVRKDPEMGKDIPAWALTLSDTANAITPRTKDLDNLTARLISRDLLSPGEIRMQRTHLISYPDWGEVLGVSGAYIALFLGLACWRFTRRDY